MTQEEALDTILHNATHLVVLIDSKGNKIQGSTSVLRTWGEVLQHFIERLPQDEQTEARTLFMKKCLQQAEKRTEASAFVLFGTIMEMVRKYLLAIEDDAEFIMLATAACEILDLLLSWGLHNPPEPAEERVVSMYKQFRESVIGKPEKGELYVDSKGTLGTECS